MLWNLRLFQFFPSFKRGSIDLFLNEFEKKLVLWLLNVKFPFWVHDSYCVMKINTIFWKLCLDFFLYSRNGSIELLITKLWRLHKSRISSCRITYIHYLFKLLINLASSHLIEFHKIKISTFHKVKSFYKIFHKILAKIKF